MVRPRGTRRLLRLAALPSLLKSPLTPVDSKTSTGFSRISFIFCIHLQDTTGVGVPCSLHPHPSLPLLEFLDHFPRNRMALRFRRIARHTHRPHPLFQAFHRQRLPTKQSVLHAKTAGAPICDARLDADHVPKRRRNEEIAACLHQWNSSDLEALQHLRLRESQCLMKQRIRARIEIFKVTRKKHNSKRVAVAPLNHNLSSVCQHSLSRLALPIGSAESTPLFHSQASHLLFLCAFTVDCLRGNTVIP